MLHGEPRGDDEQDRQSEYAPPLQPAPGLQPHGQALPQREPGPLPPGPCLDAADPTVRPGGDGDGFHAGLHHSFVPIGPFLDVIPGSRLPERPGRPPSTGRSLPRLPPLPGPFGRRGSLSPPSPFAMFSEQHLRPPAQFLRGCVAVPGPASCGRRAAATVPDAAVGHGATPRATGRSRCT